MLTNAWKKIATLISPPQLFVIGFGTLILLGALLLTLPISTRNGEGLSFVNALFTATSATCVTGLVVVDTGTTFSYFGQLVILALIQIGGLGFMTVASLFVLILGKRISLRQRLLIQESLNHLSVGGIIRLIRHVIGFTVLFEGVGTLILALRWAPDMGWGKALYYGLFHSVSNFNNAGFDLVGNFKSLTPYVDDPVVNIVIMILIIAGGIGFVVIDELVDYFKRKTDKLSLHTKVVLTTNAVLIFGGALLIFLIEFHNPKTLLPLNWTGKILGSLFQSVCARTDGANTLPIGDMHQASLLLIIVLMFIGASPGSTGGGVKTTTFATLLGAIWSMIRGQGDVVFYKQRIGQEKVYKALTLVFAALVLVIIVTMILSITENANVFMILFETTSAFGTVGLSMGLTPHLTPFGRVLLSIVMFAGRVGPLTIAFALTWDRNKKHYRYSEGKIIIG
ncbi:TrkH family potassium uptake protein [Aneurinibacillus sp. Ricciae_BoGa-3]|uniref:TrkH family potassium uptake protein n=1 Tax=Aneurinibacillus sp. Ricciae_BoGa-3 TaxID=3022697 RepID=UPI002340AE4C|nr:TrkH family potassium uptake protein [Aneurinibacillus sp. Ricciae_BoGa-3]WCK55980.1 TrkH family potassium uptake protein [Aneurinibacillus sp. Ricciae_BoGa-3]